MDAAGIARAATTMAESAGAAARRSFSLDDVRVLDELVAGWSRGDQISVARQMLAHPAVDSSPIVRGPLATLRRALGGASSQDVTVSTLLHDVQGKLSQEIDRIDGVIPSGGLDGHPDYAVVGSVRNGLDLLERLGALPAAG